MDVQSAVNYAFDRLKNELPANLYYHGLHHTHDVYEAAKNLARLENITQKETELLLTAVALHDIGFIEQYSANEPIAARIAGEVLPQFDYSFEEIKIVQSCIMATQLPQSPHTHLEQIICDADLDYLGREDFFTIAHALRREWVEYSMFGNDIPSLKNWYHLQVRFLSKHTYYTNSARVLRQDKQMHYLNQIKTLLDMPLE